MKIDAFLLHQRAFGSLSLATLQTYGNILRAFERETGADEPTLESVQQYVSALREKGRGNTRITVVLYALKKYCAWAGCGDIFSRIQIPGFEFKLPLGVPTEEEIGRLFAAAENPLQRLLVALPYSTGSRISEILNLEYQDVDWKAGILTIRRKGRRERREQIALTPDTLKLLRDYVEAQGIKSGKLFRYSYQELREYFLELAKRAGVKFPKRSLFHNLRHAFVLHQRAAGVDWPDIRQALGHSSINTTMTIYGSLQPAELRAKLKAPPWEKRDAI